MSRIRRTAGSLVVVAVAHVAYRLLAVPWIEPSHAQRTEIMVSDADIEQARRASEAHLAPYQRLFPEGAWERDQPLVLESERARLLLKRYETAPDGRVKLFPCTIVFYPQGESDDADAPKRVVILQAPQGAELQFDQPIDLRQARIGRLIGGRLDGPVTIRGTESRPGAGDSLSVATSQVQLDEDRIWTSAPVEFQLGPNHGSGREMQIRLLPRAAAGSNRGPNVGGVESLTLAKDVTMHVQPGSAGLLPGDGGRGDPLSALPGPAADQPPVDIRCQGPFRFDLVSFVATFEKQVDVVRASRTGPSDQLSCEQLSIHFAPRPETSATPVQRAAARIPDLEPRRIEARGSPVVVRSPSTGAIARGERLDYDIATRQVTLEGGDEVFLKQEINEIHARSLVYVPSRSGGLGQLSAKGPGWLRGDPPEDAVRGTGGSGPRFEAHWSGELKIRPNDQNQVISLIGGAKTSFTGQGELTAEEVHLWLREIVAEPAAGRGAAGRVRWRPDRLLATGDVQFDSPQVSGSVDRMEAWFDHEPRANVSLPSPPAGSPAGPLTRGQPNPIAGRTQNRYAVNGKLLRLQMAVRDSKTELEDVTIEGNVHFAETHTATGQRPLVITGDQLQVQGADRPDTTVTVSGKPASVSARGMEMIGQTIKLNRGTNQLWIDGAGRMALPFDGTPQGRARTPSRLTIAWRGRMDFDGLTARFERNVQVVSEGRTLKSDVLAASFARRVDFAALARQAEQPQIERINCPGEVELENQASDELGPAAFDRLVTRDLVINQRTGRIDAAGPGRLTSVRRGSPLASMASLVPRERPATDDATSNDNAEPADKTQLNYLAVQFARAITGNINRRELTFHEQVHCVYGPVQDWRQTLDPEANATLGPNDVLLECDELTVNQAGGRGVDGGPIELEAAGNTLVEGQSFTARAARMTYAQAKDLLVLEGDGRTDAELFRQPRPGDPTARFAARKILYWRSTNRVEVNDARFLDLSQLGAPPVPGGAATVRQ